MLFVTFEICFLDNSNMDSDAVMKRHFECIKKELGKKNPNMEVVNQYLDKEYEARRTWLTGLGADERVDKLLEFYPCFKDNIIEVKYSRMLSLE